MFQNFALAAASARLCVETRQRITLEGNFIAAASARLCVETHFSSLCLGVNLAAASARLCVETSGGGGSSIDERSSRLRAAVC